MTEKETKFYIITFEQKKFEMTDDERVLLGQQLNSRNIHLVSFPYKKFGIRKLFSSIGNLYSMIRVVKDKKISIIHAFGPNAGIFGYLLSWISGVKLIIDSYEPHAECMVESGEWSKNGPAHKILFKFEKLETKRADYLIGTTAAMKDYARAKYKIEPRQFFVKPACIDFTHFYPRKKSPELLEKYQLGDKIICVYAGKLGGTYLKDEVFEFVKSCYEYWGDRFVYLMLTSEDKSKVKEMVSLHGIPNEVVITEYVEHSDIPRYLSLGDFGINPQVPVPSKRYGTPIKNGEYWAMGLPVIISPKISDDSDIIEENNIGIIMDFQNKRIYTESIKKMDELLTANSKEKLQEKIFSVAKKHRSYGIAEDVYSRIYSDLNV